MKRLDLWLGKNLFQPPIIRWCQLTGMTQYAVHRYLWWVLVAYTIWGLKPDNHWALKTLLIVLGVTQTISAGLWPDKPADDNRWLRYLFIPLLAAELIAAVVMAELPSFVLIGALFAEYALTIKTIPPREAKQSEKTGRKAEV